MEATYEMDKVKTLGNLSRKHYVAGRLRKRSADACKFLAVGHCLPTVTGLADSFTSLFTVKVWHQTIFVTIYRLPPNFKSAALRSCSSLNKALSAISTGLQHPST